MVKNIVFDIGKVLVDFVPEKVMREIGIPKEEIPSLIKATCNSSWWGELDRGVMTDNEIIEHMKQDAPTLSDSIDLFFENRWKNLVELFPYAVDWIKGLKKDGFKIYLLSNYPKEAFEIHSETTFAFLPYADGKIVSSYVKLIKPDAAIYNELLKQYNLKSAECVFIDDRADNIAAAASLGFKTVHFINYEQASAALNILLEE